MVNELKEIKEDIINLQDDLHEQEAIAARIRILRFGDEVLLHQHHTKEHFDQTLKDIEVYNRYCETHPYFENQITVETAKIIKKHYEDCLMGESEFLQYDKNENKED